MDGSAAGPPGFVGWNCGGAVPKMHPNNRGREIHMRSIIAIAALIASSVGVAGHAQAQDVDLMQYADTNSDGKVTPTEYTAFCEQAWSYLSQGADKVKLADLDDGGKAAFSGVLPDGAGMITKDAYMAGAPGRFKAADKNGDGVLDAAELNASMQPPKAAG